MRVLAYLAARPGRIVRRTELLTQAWDGDAIGDEALSRCISILRKAFGDDPRHPRVIETISKSGYRLLAEVPVGSRPAAWAAAVPELFGGWLRPSATRPLRGAMTDVDWEAIVARAQAQLGVAGTPVMDEHGRGWRFGSWGSTLVLTLLPLGEGARPASQCAARVQLVDRALLLELVPVPVGLAVALLLGWGLGGLGFAAWMAFGTALALTVTSGLALLAAKRIRRRCARRRRELGRFLETITERGGPSHAEGHEVP